MELRLGTRVTSVDRAARQVRLEDGSAVGYTRLLLTTGASARRLAVPGADLDGLLYLRTMGESSALAARIKQGGRVVIAGAGWIGLEAAAAAREAGCEVTIVEPESAPLLRWIGPELGEVFGRLHRSHGVTFRFGETVAELRGDTGSAGASQARGTVRQVVTSAGTVLDADFVLAAVGAAAENTGLGGRRGPRRRGTASWSTPRCAPVTPDIFRGGGRGRTRSTRCSAGADITVQHWSNALNGGPAAARAMLGQEVSYDRVPYFFTDQYDLGMETAGLPEPGAYDQVAYRGDPESGEFIAFWLSGGTLVAGMNVNVWDVNDTIQALIRAGGPVDVARLTDPDVPLGEV